MGWRALKVVCTLAAAVFALPGRADPSYHPGRASVQLFDGDRGRHMARLREERLEELRQQQRAAVAPPPESGRVQAVYDSETTSGVRKMSPDERRRLRRDVREAAREVYRQSP